MGISKKISYKKIYYETNNKKDKKELLNKQQKQI
jgi:hypothetical protein